ncbi:pilus assembly FimT family protein [Polystyrenella longa]|uniref:pilus assembly FimT family protein n=1 Tax=Polystyrenella longa TaxID=2528007 RepID=UPI0011A7FCC3|nr:type II secretion system protein [Polystyrenella longa]
MTLIDLVLTIIIIGILSAVAMPRFSKAIEEQRVRASARRIKADLELAARYSRSNSQSETITFNTDDHSYSFSSFKDIDHSSQAYTVWLNTSPYHSTIQSLDLDDGSVTFNAYGIPSTDLEISVTNGDLTKTITMESITGQVQIQE